MTRTTLLCLLAIGMALTSCATHSPKVINEPVRIGMTSGELRSVFGEPLRVVDRADGGQDWVYHFGSQEKESKPFSESTTTGTEHTFTVGHTDTTTTTKTPSPVRLSAAGRVIGPVPEGSVIVE